MEATMTDFSATGEQTNWRYCKESDVIRSIFFFQTDRIEDHGDSCVYKSPQTKLQFIYKYYVQFV